MVSSLSVLLYMCHHEKTCFFAYAKKKALLISLYTAYIRVILTANLAMTFAPAPSPRPTTFFTLKKEMVFLLN